MYRSRALGTSAGRQPAPDGRKARQEIGAGGTQTTMRNYVQRHDEASAYASRSIRQVATTRADCDRRNTYQGADVRTRITRKLCVADPQLIVHRLRRIEFGVERYPNQVRSCIRHRTVPVQSQTSHVCCCCCCCCNNCPSATSAGRLLATVWLTKWEEA